MIQKKSLISNLNATKKAVLASKTSTPAQVSESPKMSKHVMPSLSKQVSPSLSKQASPSLSKQASPSLSKQASPSLSKIMKY